MPLDEAVAAIQKRRSAISRQLDELTERAVPLRIEYSRLGAALRSLGQARTDDYHASETLPRPGTIGALVLNILRDAKHPMKLNELSKLLGRESVNMGTVLKRLMRYGVVIRVSHGHYIDRILSVPNGNEAEKKGDS